jgi:hypothetical protein
MTPTNHEPPQGKASSLQAEEPTPVPTIWLCPHVSNTLEQVRTLFLYKPPDAKHGYQEWTRTCGRPCYRNISTHVVHYLTEPPALAVRNLIRLFEMEKVCNRINALKSRTTADHLHTAISNLRFLRLPLCKHLCLSDLLAGRTLPLPNDVLTQGLRCGCPDAANLSSPRFRHFLSCRMYTVCQACHIEGSYTAVALIATEGKYDAAKLSLVLDVWRELGCAMDESDPGWKCHALSSSTMADVQEDWVRWTQFANSKRPQWKTSCEASTSTGLGFLDRVRKFLEM